MTKVNMGSLAKVIKPHLVCIPFPAQGHINPMLKLAKLLHNKGFHITFVNTEYNHKRLLKSRGPDSLNGLPDFQFTTIPDGLPLSDTDSTQSIPALFAEELGIPEVLFWTTSACGFMGYIQYPHLVEYGLTPLKDVSYLTNGFLDTPVDWIPGIKEIRLRDLPSFIRTTDPNDSMINFCIVQVKRAEKASAIILNTFDALEHDVLSAIQSKLPPVYSIGSLHLLEKQISDKRLDSIGSNLWKEETECLQWLDSKEPNSVVYVNFGSITVMTPQQMIEFAWGLASSKQTFLWIIRPDLISGEAAVLTPEFIMETKERSLLACWCPQEQVLKHPSIGGFLTHSGWNSTLESMCSGVPMICWPFFAEQQLNCRYACVHWGVGMEIDSNVKRVEVGNLVNKLMNGKKGKEMKIRAMEWKKEAIEASGPGGSSYENIDKLVNEILINKI